MSISRRVDFPDGSWVMASPLSARRESDPVRDFGLYLDAAWAPTWPAEVIDWPDYGLPTQPDRAMSRIASAFERARDGQSVEVGCIGGLGRTGTVLACMAVLAGVAADEAVAWVRTHYDPRAVETEGQERWVLEFAVWLDRRAVSGGPACLE